MLLTEDEKKDDTTTRFAMLKALQQAVSHTFGLETIFRNKLGREVLQTMKKKLKEEGKQSTMLEHLRTNATESTGIASFKSGLDKMETYQDTSFGGTFDMTRLLELLENEARLQSEECPVCHKSPPVDPVHSQYVSI